MVTHSLPGKSHGQRSLAATAHRVAKSRTQLSTHARVHLGAGTGVGIKTRSIPSLEVLLGQRPRWEVLQ